MFRTEKRIVINVVTTLGSPITMPEEITTLGDCGEVSPQAATWDSFDENIFCKAGRYEVLGSTKNGKPLKGIVHVFPTTNPIKVAMIGDSITYGMGVSGVNVNSYPLQLNYRLGRNYKVENYGNSGRTLLENGDGPYIKTNEYKNSLVSNPDVVVIMLGTNDTKPQNFVKIHEFVDDYVKLIHSYASLSSKPVVYVSFPPIVARTAYGITQANLEKIIPLIWEAGEKSGVEVTVIDNFTATLKAGALIPDGVHPDARGAAILANNVFTNLHGRNAVNPQNISLNDYFETYGGLNLGTVMDGLTGLGSLAHTNWVSFKNILLTGKNIEIKAAIPHDRTKVKVYKKGDDGGIMIGEADLVRTGNVNIYADYLIDIQGEVGINDIALLFERDGSSVNAELVRLQEVDFHSEQ